MLRRGPAVLKSRLVAIAFLSAFAVGLSAHAEESQDMFVSGRAHSMGRALTAIVDDEDSLSFNPAGLALIQQSKVVAPNLAQVEYSRDFRSFLTAFNKLPKTSSTLDIVSGLRSFDGLAASARGDFLGFGWYRPRFGVSINLISLSGSIRVRLPSPLFASMKLRLVADSALSVGFANSYYNDALRFGFVVRPAIIRAGVQKQFTNAEILQAQGLKVEDLGGTGLGFDGDVGVQGQTGVFKHGTSALGVRLMGGMVAQNLMGTKFPIPLTSGATSNGSRDFGGITGKFPPQNAVSSPGLPRFEGIRAIRPTVSFDLRDIFVATDGWTDKTALAFELALKPESWFQTAFRGHIYKGNWGGGIGSKVGASDLEFGTYAVNLGSGVGVGVDRRYYGQLKFTW